MTELDAITRIEEKAMTATKYSNIPWAQLYVGDVRYLLAQLATLRKHRDQEADDNERRVNEALAQLAARDEELERLRRVAEAAGGVEGGLLIGLRLVEVYDDEDGESRSRLVGIGGDLSDALAALTSQEPT